jgi:hypothetical protein
LSFCRATTPRIPFDVPRLPDTAEDLSRNPLFPV